MTDNDGHYQIQGIKHHLLDRFEPDEECNVAIFRDLLEYEVNKIHDRGNIPFLVGGSLFYIDAYAYNYSLPPVEPDEKLRKGMEKKSSEELWKELCQIDPDAEWTVDKNNRRRVVRALEVCLKTGKPFTEQKDRGEIKPNVLYLIVDKDREELYRNINRRVGEMIDMGLVDEVKKLYQKYDGTTALQAAGYRQIIEYLEGKVTLEKAIENTKRVHRNFAKRQLTWLKKNQDGVWIKDASAAKKEIRKFLKAV